jgi:hypothetical protein
VRLKGIVSGTFEVKELINDQEITHRRSEI